MTTPTWDPPAPWMQFDGENGEEIASAMTRASRWNSAEVDQVTIFVNPDYTGPSLSMSQRYPDLQIGADRWRVPVNYWINPETGEVRDPEGTAMAWETLVQMG